MHSARLAWIAGPQLASVAILTGVGVALAARVSPEAAALVASAGVAGNVLGHTTATWTLRRPHPRTAALALLAAWSLTAIASLLLLLAPHPPVLALAGTSVAMMVAWSQLGVLGRDTVGGWGTDWLRRVGPVGRVGAALGAIIGSAVAVTGAPILLLAALVPAAGLSPALRAHHAAAAQRVRTWDWPTFTANLMLAACGYGPLVLQVAFVAATAGPAWAGASMAVYAAAALAAPRLVRLLPGGATVSPLAWLTLATIADLTWIATTAHPIAGMLIARVLSALALFAAEGSADIAAYRRSAAAAALSGRSIGGLLAGVAGTALLAATGSVLVTAAALAALGPLGIGAWLIARRVRRHQAHRQHASHALLETA